MYTALYLATSVNESCGSINRSDDLKILFCEWKKQQTPTTLHCHPTELSHPPFRLTQVLVDTSSGVVLVVICLGDYYNSFVLAYCMPSPKQVSVCLHALSASAHPQGSIVSIDTTKNNSSYLPHN